MFEAITIRKNWKIELHSRRVEICIQTLESPKTNKLKLNDIEESWDSLHHFMLAGNNEILIN